MIKKMKAKIHFLLPFVVISLANSSCKKSGYVERLDDILGFPAPKVSQILIEEDILGFNEGYVIEKIIFSNDNSSSLSLERLNLFNREGYESSNWAPSQIISNENKKVLEMAFRYVSKDPDISDMQTEMMESFEKKNGYIAFYCKPSCLNPIQSILFILDIEDNCIWVCEAFF